MRVSKTIHQIHVVFQIHIQQLPIHDFHDNKNCSLTIGIWYDEKFLGKTYPKNKQKTFKMTWSGVEICTVCATEEGISHTQLLAFLKVQCQSDKTEAAWLDLLNKCLPRTRSVPSFPGWSSSRRSTWRQKDFDLSWNDFDLSWNDFWSQLKRFLISVEIIFDLSWTQTKPNLEQDGHPLLSSLSLRANCACNCHWRCLCNCKCFCDCKCHCNCHRKCNCKCDYHCKCN